jgi:hypothetical protein
MRRFALHTLTISKSGADSNCVLHLHSVYIGERLDEVGIEFKKKHAGLDHSRERNLDETAVHRHDSPQADEP